MPDTELLKEWHQKFGNWERARTKISEDLRLSAKSLLDHRGDLEEAKTETLREMDRLHRQLGDEFEGKRSNAEERERRLRELTKGDDYHVAALERENNIRREVQDAQFNVEEYLRKDSLIKDMMRAEIALINYLQTGAE